VLIHLSSGDQRTDVTGASGTSQFEGLAPGEYRIEISPMFAVIVTPDSGYHGVAASQKSCAARRIPVDARTPRIKTTRTRFDASIRVSRRTAQYSRSRRLDLNIL
jgi:hypothetical protein